MIDFLLQTEIEKYVKDHEQHDPSLLMLQNKKYSSEQMKLIVQQIQGKQIARTKLDSWYQTEKIMYPPHISMEQCSSEATATYKAEIFKGEVLADLTGGAGADSFFLSKSFNKVYYVEQNSLLSQHANHNFKVLEASNIVVNATSAAAFLDQNIETITHYYIDPSRRNNINQKVFLLIDCEPNIIELLPKLISNHKTVMIKTSPLFDIEQAIKDLQYVVSVHIVAVENECKEVLYVLNEDVKDDPHFVTINLKKEGRQVFDFDKNEKKVAEAIFSKPLHYLYEPNTAILKSGAFNLVGQRFGVQKLHANSHLYTSDVKVEDFPGRIFMIKDVTTLDKKKLATILPAQKANITTRNFPFTVADIRKKTGLAEGGAQYLFATTDISDKPVIIICEKA